MIYCLSLSDGKSPFIFLLGISYATDIDFLLSLRQPRISVNFKNTVNLRSIDSDHNKVQFSILNQFLRIKSPFMNTFFRGDDT